MLGPKRAAREGPPGGRVNPPPDGPASSPRTAGLASDRGARELALLAGLVAQGRLDGNVTREASWREAGAAVTALTDRSLTGKAVLRVD